MDNTLSSIGVFNADFSNITSDNTTIFSSLNVSGVNILSSLSTINSNLSTINSNLSSVNNNIYSTQSSLNVCNSNEIDFYCGATFVTNINLSGSNVFTNGRNTFPFTPCGYYNVSER